ncbi:MAG TPA: hypothetical protein VFG47_04535 [Geminicoccaceae bacterium]|nr:hypothetical protein [Geminicoccaceae bacterium]
MRLGRSPSARRYARADGTFTKFFERDVELEAEKAAALFALAARNGFVAPRPLSADPAGGSLSFEYIPGPPRSVRDLYLAYVAGTSPPARTPRTFHEIGSMLGAIHRELSLPSRRAWRPTEPFDTAMCRAWGEGYGAPLAATPHAFLHGDFGFSNVLLLDGHAPPRIAVIDPSPNGYVTFHCDTFASVYLDLAKFVCCLDGLVPPVHHAAIDWRRAVALRDAFLDGYGARTGLAIDRRLLDGLAFATAAAKFAKEYPSPVLRRLALWLLYRPRKRRVLFGASG